MTVGPRSRRARLWAAVYAAVADPDAPAAAWNDDESAETESTPDGQPASSEDG